MNEVSNYPLGTRFFAGLSYATVLADLDFETYSEAGYVWHAESGRWTCLPRAAQGKKGLTIVGAARYAEHPTTEILCLSYNLKDGRGPRLWRPGDPLPWDLFLYIGQGGLLEAWNVGFERYIWERICVPRLGWPAVARGQWRCAMAKARAHALPGALDNASNVLQTRNRKDKRGKALLQKFSVPRNPTKANANLRIRPGDELAAANELYAYNLGDIATEADISSVTPDQSPEELEYWQVDQEINTRGVQVDTEGIANCSAIVEAALARYDRELAELTGGTVTAASQLERLHRWLVLQGVYTATLDEESVTEVLRRPELPPAARRALEIRQTVGSASVKKLFAMQNSVCADGRLRDLFTYHGARTGRCTGNGPQPTNLPNSGPPVRRCTTCTRHYGASKTCCPWCGHSGDKVEWSAAAAVDALVAMRTRSLDLMELYFDDAMPAVSGCLRAMFVSKPGYDLISADYNSIEAVVLAEMAGESWRQDVFRTHGKIYEMSASKITGVPFEEFLDYKKRTGEHHPFRKKGKIAELALGYGGWVGALVAFGADEFMSELEMAEAAARWRDESPNIREFWGGQSRWKRPELFGLEGAAVMAILSPGAEVSFRGMSFVVADDVMYFRLLSGRYLTYHRPRLTPSTRRPNEWQISYEGWNTNPKNGAVGWVRMDTYGPKLAENAVQATSRDIQRRSLVLQERMGYAIVLHVYDENTAEIPEGWGSVAEFETLMTTLPSFAAGWAIRATGGWRGKYYRKG